MAKLLRDMIVQVVWSDGEVNRTGVSTTHELKSTIDRVAHGLNTRVVDYMKTGERASAVVTLMFNSDFNTEGENNEVQDPQDPG